MTESLRHARQGTADLAKGSAVLLMIQVHLTELFARQEFFDGTAGRISLFLGGPPVAPVFMAVLGYFVAASRRTPAQLMLRGLALFGLALLLNIGLNLHLLLKIANGTFDINPWEYVFGIDILFLAAVSILLLAGLRLIFRKSATAFLLTAAVVAAMAPVLHETLTVTSSARYALALLGGDYRWSYFPVFPWLAYPLLGYAFYLLRQRYKAGKRPFKALKTADADVMRAIHISSLIATGLVVGATFKYGFTIAADLEAYYHHGLRFFGWTATFISCWMLALLLTERAIGKTAPARYVQWLGKHVTTAYILQWLIIGNLATWLYKSQGPVLLVLWYVAIVIAVSVGTKTFEKFKRSRRDTGAGERDTEPSLEAMKP